MMGRWYHAKRRITQINIWLKTSQYLLNVSSSFFYVFCLFTESTCYCCMFSYVSVCIDPVQMLLKTRQLQKALNHSKNEILWLSLALLREFQRPCLPGTKMAEIKAQGLNGRSHRLLIHKMENTIVKLQTNMEQETLIFSRLMLNVSTAVFTGWFYYLHHFEWECSIWLLIHSAVFGLKTHWNSLF